MSEDVVLCGGPACRNPECFCDEEKTEALVAELAEDLLAAAMDLHQALKVPNFTAASEALTKVYEYVHELDENL